jgi:hypothetical protein
MGETRKRSGWNCRSCHAVLSQSIHTQVPASMLAAGPTQVRQPVLATEALGHWATAKSAQQHLCPANGPKC